MAEKPADRLHAGEAWDAFCDKLKDTGRAVLDAAPDDEFDRAEGLRYLSRLTRNFMRATLEDADPARARLSTESPKIGLDNPDYVYAGARLSGNFQYELRGRLGDAHMLGIGAFSGGLGTKAGLIRDGYITSDQLEFEADGSFVVALSQEEQPKNWLPMKAETNSLNVRQTLLRRREQTPATLELVRVDQGASPQPLDPARFAAGLERVGLIVDATVRQFLTWTAHFQSHAFEVREIDPKFLKVAQGDPNTRYFYSYFEIDEDEAFVVEFKPPPCDYWNLQIGNHWLESLDYEHATTHVNHETAVQRPDGSVRVVIASRDPRSENWLDTMGHRRGALALRWVGADEVPETTSRVVSIDSL
ncbi:MAG: DUF1214 domain-containing protein [Myxococcota bacterium]|nr:DUF1214 domain-containing protein [Myxococcota bacterium]